MNKDIFLTNNLSNKKEKFVPIDEKKIGMYVCGPTVYDDPHIGNARPLVIFDILFKVLKCRYGKDAVTYIRNITDVDDKIIKSAKENKILIQDLTKKIIKDFEEDCQFLNLDSPSKEPKATDHIDSMIEMITVLIEKNFAYEKNNHIYFEVNKFKDYGKLSNKKLEDLIVGSRVEVSENKKNPEDFVLWKPSIGDEPYWDSPWGKGRPGWHLECSSMSKKYLGDKFDIHGGGIDLLFPHHENEIAQSRCANDTEVFANYWVHNGFITMSNEKMAKAQGNILSIKEVKEWGAGQVLKLALMSSHYRQPLDWNEKLYEDCKNTIQKWYDGVDKTPIVSFDTDKIFPGKIGKHLLEKTVFIPDEILEPLYDDLNTPGYIANLHKLFDNVLKGNENDKKVFISACNFVGLLLESKEDWHYARLQAAKIESKVIIEKIELLNKARENKDYVKADMIRKELLDNGIAIENKDGKTVWKLK
jgi:cysteinyl-tRNA synthetase